MLYALIGLAVGYMLVSKKPSASADPYYSKTNPNGPNYDPYYSPENPNGPNADPYYSENNPNGPNYTGPGPSDST